MKRVILLVVAACGGGAKPSTNPSTPDIAGVIWETPRKPWHVLHGGYSGAVTGERVTLGGSNGWVHQVDLSTGRPIRERKLDMGTVTAVVDLGDDRIFVLGFAGRDLHAPPVAFVFDAAFEPKPVELPVREAAWSPAIFPLAARLADGGLVINGSGLPLSVYDPKDFRVRVTLDSAIGWTGVGARGEIVLATRLGYTRRFDLGTNGQRDLGHGMATHWVSTDQGDIVRVLRDGKMTAAIYRDDKTKVELPDQINSLHAYDGKRFITTAGNELRIHEMPGGEIKKRVKVDDNAYVSSLVVSGNRAIWTWNGVMRVIDLETGTMSPKDVASRHGVWLAVGNEGVVLAGNAPSVWTIAGGKIASSEQFAQTTTGGEPAIETIRSDDPRHYVTGRRIGVGTTLELRTIGDKAIRKVELPGEVSEVYIGADTSLLIETDGETGKQLLRAKDKEPVPLFAFNASASVIGADPDGDIMISAKGRVAVVGQDGKQISTLRIPHCDASERGVVEIGGTRAITLGNTKDVALWNRKTGKLLATSKLGRMEDVLFIPKREEIVLTTDERVVLWSPGKATRTLRWSGVVEPAVSPDGKKLALSFFDGRVGVYDIDALLASTAKDAELPGDPVPESCGDEDPLAVEDTDDPPPSEADDDARWGED